MQRPLFALLLLLSLMVGCLLVVARNSRVEGHGVCHPNLSRLSGPDGKEVLLVGSLSLDLDGASGAIVREALDALRPDIVMVEGTPNAGVSAMFLTGRWELHGQPPAPGDFNWTEVGDAEPVELSRPKRRGFLGQPPPPYPKTSFVPVKVGNWAFHLRGAVGTDLAAAMVVAAAKGVPVHFLGPNNGGVQGHYQVNMLAQQAAVELLEEEQQSGAQMDQATVDAALRRAEGRVRSEADKWLRDVRGETAKVMEHLKQHVPAQVHQELTEKLRERTQGIAERAANTMQAHERGAVVVCMEQFVAVEEQLKNAGYSYVSDCA